MSGTGKFISFEGGEGVGKSTQVRLLGATLRERGVEVVETREPGGTTGAEAIRGLLLQGAEDRWGARAEALLFAAARADHVARVIEPGLKRDAWILCDRYVDSTRAYQGAAGGLSDDDIMMLHSVGSAGLLPHRTILLDASTEAVAARLARRGNVDRMGSRDATYYQRVLEGFERLAETEPMRFRRVNGNGKPEAVAADVLAAVADLLSC